MLYHIDKQSIFIRLDDSIGSESALGFVGILDSHLGVAVIQAVNGTICTDGRPMGEDGTALSW
ncbi:hypothetical protein, partial [Acidiphilium sp. 20-67-58]|uniref:hypothetical protein n=1 Tax=Acidiphilium sp. 20-67-58 TaxID=1970291 RepID=UPI0025C42BD0